MASLKLCKFIENLKSYTNSYWQTDTCYICNLRNCTNLSAPINSNGGQLVENMQLPFCANCYATLPWRMCTGNVLQLAWRTYDLSCNCLVSTYYRDVICTLVRRYKFHQAAYLAKLFGYMLAQTYWRYQKMLEQGTIRPSYNDLPKIDYVSYVPLHAERKKERAYDQAECLAKYCAKALNLPCKTSLCRIRNTSRQSSLAHRAERLQNVKSAFSVLDKNSVCGKNILLIDDVISTGASLMTAVQVLQANGAYGVLCLALSSNLSEQIVHYIDGHN